MITYQSGRKNDLKWMEARLQNKYDIETKWLGPDENHQREVRIFNRIILYEDVGIGYEADPRHVETMIEELGFKESTIVNTPGTSIAGRIKDDCNESFGDGTDTRYRT